MFDRAEFFDRLRPKLNLTTSNVQGIEKVLAYAESVRTAIAFLAYILATAWWETAQTMQPIKEAYWLSEDWRRRNLRYFPFYGRGLVQVTWEDNYRKVAVLLGLPEDHFIDNPDDLLEWKHALPALFLGMETGLYTGHDLDDHIDDIDESDEEDLREFIAARRIVNGTDRDEEIGRLALTFEKALRRSHRAETPAESVRDRLVLWRIAGGMIVAGLVAAAVRFRRPILDWARRVPRWQAAIAGTLFLAALVAGFVLVLGG